MSNDLEIYKQRFETFRHLDGIRYQVQNISILLGTLFAGYVANQNGEFHPILGIIIGTVFIVFGYTMLSISRGIVKNSIVLNEIGSKVGDINIPVASLGPKSSTFWTTCVTIVIGLGLLAISVCKLFAA